MMQIDIAWEGPFPVGYDRQSDLYIAPDLPPDLGGRFGVYQIYGDHPVYGRDSLLYIGETRQSDSGRALVDRLKEHLAQRFWYHTGLCIHLGLVTHQEVPVTDRDTLDAVESLLIASNVPALNRQHIDFARESARDLLVVNWGFRGRIVPEASGVLNCEW